MPSQSSQQETIAARSQNEATPLSLSVSTMSREEHWATVYQNPCSRHMLVAVHYLLIKYESNNGKLHVLWKRVTVKAKALRHES